MVVHACWRIAAAAIAEARPRTSADFDTAVQVRLRARLPAALR